MAASPHKPRQWTRDGFVVSTDKSLVSLSALNKALDSDFVYWANAIPEAELKLMVDSSICFGVYTPTGALPPNTSDSEARVADASNQSAADTLHEVAERVHHLAPPRAAAAEAPSTPSGAEYNMIGFARLVSDYVSVAYLTDVYVLPEWQSQGLGSWLIGCIKEYTDSMPRLRALILVTDEGKKEEYYAKKLGTRRLEVESPGHRLFFAKGPGSSL